MPRINRVAKAQKDQGKCGKCQTPILKGMPYKWIKPRYGGKRIVCDKCQFSDSDLTSSKMSQVYDARDSALAELGKWSPEDGAEALRDIGTTAAEAIREVGEEYQSSADSIHDRFSESTVADDCEEKANSLEDYASEIEEAVEDEFEEDDAKQEAEEEFETEHPKPTDDQLAKWEEEREDYVEQQVQEKLLEWGEEARGKLEEALGNCP